MELDQAFQELLILSPDGFVTLRSCSKERHERAPHSWPKRFALSISEGGSYVFGNSPEEAIETLYDQMSKTSLNDLIEAFKENKPIKDICDRLGFKIETAVSLFKRYLKRRIIDFGLEIREERRSQDDDSYIFMFVSGSLYCDIQLYDDGIVLGEIIKKGYEPLILDGPIDSILEKIKTEFLST